MDLLLYGEHTVSEETLTVPHPRIRERAFVLLPLLEIAPKWVVRNPTTTELPTVTELVAVLDTRGILRTDHSLC
jgi:2-amino-4-hydroxy-6-hydroxymethyldihydropteridine diphosphokinase